MAKLQSPLKTGDEVIVISGKDKGKTGKISRVVTKTNRVVVEGVNVVKRHMKATMASETGVETKEAPIHASNVMLKDPETGKPTRIGHKIENGNKVRFAKKSGKVLG